MLTFRYFPGQTIYHDAMLIEKEEKNESIFFVGDSFTPSGIDDYCLQNRNLLHDGMGYFYCFDILKNLPAATLLVNQHVAPLFAFSTQQLKRMKQSLLKRNDILKELLPWDDINYGIDEQWSKLYPYGQKIKAGETVKFSVKIFNHSKKQKLFVVKPNVPNGFSGDSAIISFSIAPGKEGERTFILTASPKLLPGVFLLTVNVKFDNVDLREWSEAIIEVLP